jgi:lipopolysaccharide export system protein LptA
MAKLINFKMLKSKKNKKYIVALNFIIYSIILFFTFQINSLSQNRQPILLKNADSLVGITLENSQVRNFIGNVIFEQGNIILTCDTAIQYIDQNRVQLIGRVNIKQDLTLIKSNRINYTGNNKIANAEDYVEIQDTANTLKAKTGTYNLDTKIAHFKQNVSIENDSILIFTDELVNNTSNDESFATGNVRVYGKKIRTATICDTLVYKPKQDFLLAYSNAGFFYIDSVKKNYDSTQKTHKVEFDTLSVFANTIFGNQAKGQEFYQFLDSVEIIKGLIKSKCNKADYFKTGDSILLTGEPVVWYDSLQLFSDSISVIFPGRNIKQIKLVNNSLVISTSDSLGLGRINQITGKDIDINFERDSIRAIISKNDAHSLYFITTDDGESGAQTSGADTIKIYMQNNEVSDIVWRSAAFIDFYPDNIITNPKDLFLPKFRKREDLPKRRNFPEKPFNR